MLTRKGGQEVEAGTYWDIETGERIEFEEKGVLPGEDTTRYIRASSIVMLLIGPPLGLLYALYLPFVGIALTLGLLGRKLMSMAGKAGREMADTTARSAVFGWKPVQAHLTSKEKKKKDRSTGDATGMK